MSRRFVIFAAAAIALSSLAVASTIARSGGVAPYQTKADFDQAFAMAGASNSLMLGRIDPEVFRQAGLRRISQ
jgi:hypothetical protein